MIPDTLLIVAEPFPACSAQRVAEALARGVREGEHAGGIDTLFAHAALAGQGSRGGAREWWGTAEHAARLRAARAVMIAAALLDERTLAGSMAFEVATGARQSGVPAYAVTAHNALDPFDARMLDLQVILQASTARALVSAGRRLAALV